MQQQIHALAMQGARDGRADAMGATGNQGGTADQFGGALGYVLSGIPPLPRILSIAADSVIPASTNLDVTVDAEAGEP